MKKKKLILFDFDGTLLDSDQMIVVTFQQLYALYKKDNVFDLKKVLTFSGPPIKETLKNEFPDIDQDFIFNEYEKGNVLTNELLSNKYYELNKEYFGSDIIINDEIRYEWERIPHFYYDFYVYQYATGLSAACYIVNRIRNHEENAVEDYLEFLKTGDSKDPIEELKVAGVDMLDEKVVNGAIDMFQELINEYKSLM